MRKQKRLTKRQFAQMSEDYRLHNKKMKQSNNLSLCFSSFEGILTGDSGALQRPLHVVPQRLVR